MEDRVRKLYEAVKEIVSEETLTVENIVTVVVQVMTLVEKYPNMKGAEKKNLVLHTLKLFAENEITEEETRNQVSLLLDFTVPILIDTLVEVDRGEVKIRIPKSCGCLNLFCIRN